MLEEDKLGYPGKITMVHTDVDGTWVYIDDSISIDRLPISICRGFKPKVGDKVRIVGDKIFKMKNGV